MIVYGFYGTGKTTAAGVLRERGVPCEDLDEAYTCKRGLPYGRLAASMNRTGGVLFVNGGLRAVAFMRPRLAFAPKRLEWSFARLSARGGVYCELAAMMERMKDGIMQWLSSAPFGRIIWLDEHEHVADYAGLIAEMADRERRLLPPDVSIDAGPIRSGMVLAEGMHQHPLEPSLASPAPARPLSCLSCSADALQARLPEISFAPERLAHPALEAMLHEQRH